MAVQVLPTDGVHVHVNPAPANAAGNGSDTLAPTAFDGPALVTVTVNANAAPGTYGLGTAPLLTAIDTLGPGGLASLAEQDGKQPGSVVFAGGLTVAVFTTWPEAPAGTVPEIV